MHLIKIRKLNNAVEHILQAGCERKSELCCSDLTCSKKVEDLYLVEKAYHSTADDQTLKVAITPKPFMVQPVESRG